jgi:chaperonin GroES
MSTPIKPLGDRVVATREKAAERTASGLYIPESAQEKTTIFTVEAVGPSVKTVKPGDKILYNGYTSEFKYGGTDYLIIKEEDILATV